jgi:hypothetical protein
MVTRGSAARGTPASESTARETGESSAQQIEQEASTASGTKESEVTQADLQDMIAEQRKFTQVVLEKLAASEARQAATDARLDRAESRAPRPFSSLTEYSIARSPPPQPPIPAAIFRMRDPAKFCDGAAELERFLTQLELLFESHDRHFPRGDPDKVQYTTGLLGTWTEHVDESLRKTQMTSPAEWASELVLARSDCLRDSDLFEAEIREMYGDRERRLNAAARAYAEYMQGALDSNKTVKAYANRMQSNWREAGWKAGPEEPKAQQMLYDLDWSGLRAGIKARIRPFAGKRGQFDTVEELFEKAHEVEVKPSRDRRAPQPASTAEKHGNSGGTSGGKDKKRPYAGRDTAPAPQPSSSRDTPNRQGGRSRLPPVPWVDQPTWANRKDRGLCTRCGEKHLTFKCTKYSRSHRPPQTNDDRQNRHKRPRVTDTKQAKNQLTSRGI